MRRQPGSGQGNTPWGEAREQGLSRLADGYVEALADARKLQRQIVGQSGLGDG
jgi:hypothetical protein